MVRELKLPFAVAINRSDMGDDGVVQYCRRENIEIALEIPNDRRIASVKCSPAVGAAIDPASRANTV